MPRVWADTIEAHRREVQGAILDATAALAIEHGLTAVTMSSIAEGAGIGRATLYKYFSNVEEILIAWHERQVADHLAQLTEAAGRDGTARERLGAVLEAFALISHERHDAELAALVHRGEHVARAQAHLTHFVRDLTAEAVSAGDVRDDISAGELAMFSLHAAAGASSLPTKAAVRRLVAVILQGLDPTA